MNSERLVTVATFDLPSEAEAVRVALEAEGIQAFLSDDNLVRTNWFLANAVGGSKLQVPESLAARAAQLIQQARETRARTSKAASVNEPDISFACEECGRMISFPAHRRGGVESCPYCHEYVDVPE